jgi:peptide/nickel transport system substrate-binding protein
MRSDTWLRGAVLAACVTFGAPALAQKSADTLRITWRDAIPDVDPYYNSQRTGMVVAFQAFDCLAYRDPTSMENEAGAGHLVEAGRPDHARVHPAQRCHIPKR